MSWDTDTPTAGRADGFGASVRTWRYLLVIVGLVVTVLLFYAEENWRGYHAWQTHKQQLAASGQPIIPEAFIPPRVPDEQNFAMTPALAPLFEFVPGTQHWRDTNAPRLFASITAKYDAAANLIKPAPTFRVNSWVRPRTDLAAWAWAFAQGTNRNARGHEPVMPANFTSQDAALAVLRGLADLGPVLDELRQASQRPYARFNLRYEEENPAVILLPHLAKIKYFCQMLQLRASAELQLGRTQDAQADLDLLFYLTDTSRSEPIVISQLVRMAELQLALQPLAEGMGKWSESQLNELRQRLAGFDFLADTTRALEAERMLFGVGEIEFVRRSSHKFRIMDEIGDSGGNSDGGGVWTVGPLLALAPNGWLYLEERNYSRFFGEQLLPLIDLTNRVIRPDAARQSEAIFQETIKGTPISKFLHHELFASLLVPALSRVSQKAAAAQTAVDLATIACALESYRLARGHFPDSLDKLMPEYLVKLPHDIITGNPLRYRLYPEGHYVLYSVGWNERDDRGTIKQSKNGAIEQNEGDWVWTDDM